MSNNYSPVEKLLTENPKLQELRQPFDEYYAYYKLRGLLEKEMTKFLSGEEAYINSMELFIPKDDKVIKSKDQSFSSPYKLSDFLPRHDEKKGYSSKLTSQLFNNILQAPNSKGGDRNKIKSFRFNKTDKTKKNGLGGIGEKQVGPSMISAFSRRADLCRKKSKENDHSDTKFLDFISAFCGYDNFQNFLNTEFGPDYRKEEDMTLQGLLQKYQFEKEQATVSTQNSEFETTTQLVSKSIHKPEILVGRDKDLEKILDILNSKGRVAVIGEGGMGKTSVAASLYHRALERRSYSDVAWLFCEHGTISALSEAALGLGINLEVLSPDDRLPSITHAMQRKGKNLLLVLDNVENDLGDFFQEFQGFDGHVLITSRSSFGWEGLEEHRLPALSTENAKILFITHYSGKKGPLESGAEFEELLDRLISAIGYNTLLIELFAKLLKQDFSDTAGSEYGIRQFLEKLEAVGLSIADGEVKTNYSFHRRQKVATIPEILDILYDFSKIDEITRYLLVNLSLLSTQEISYKELLEIFAPTDQLQFRRTLGKLYSQGWIGGDGRKIVRVSPVVQEMTIRKNKDTLWEDGKSLVERVSLMLQFNPEHEDIRSKFKWLQIATILFHELKEFIPSNFLHFQKNLAALLEYIGGKNNLEKGLRILYAAISRDFGEFEPDNPQIASIREILAKVHIRLGGRRHSEKGLIQLGKALRSNQMHFGSGSTEAIKCVSEILIILVDLELDQEIMTPFYNNDIVEKLKYNHNVIKLQSNTINSKFNNPQTREKFGLQYIDEEEISGSIQMGNTLRYRLDIYNLLLPEFFINIAESQKSINFLAKSLNLVNFEFSDCEEDFANSSLFQLLKEILSQLILNVVKEKLQTIFDRNILFIVDDYSQVRVSRLKFSRILRDLRGLEDLERAKKDILLTLKTNILSNESYSMNYLNSFQVYSKRLVDVFLCSIFLLTIGWWLFLFLSICISFDSKGPVLFKQLKYGRNNLPFSCYEFRTKFDPASKLPHAQRNDIKFTRVGYFLHFTCLDKLPQIYNILVGDMSIVGLNPNLSPLNQGHSEIKKHLMCRHIAKPGIAGLAQSAGFRGEIKNHRDIHFRLTYERFYVKKWSLLFDFKIMLSIVKDFFFNNSNAY